MEMDDLRWILAGVAVVIIAAVYIFSRVRKKEQSYSPLDAANEVPSFSADVDEADNNWMDGVGPVRVVSSVRDVPPVQPEPETRATESEPYAAKPVVNKVEADKTEVDKPVAEDSVSKKPTIQKEAEVEKESTENSQPENTSDAAIDDVISVYVLAHQDEKIKGEKILSASYALHLEFGEMKIFHRHSESEKKNIQFSMANIQQPGWFDIDEMNQLETSGVSFFMQVNLVDNASAVLDDMLICAHGLSTMLGASLCNAQRKQLDEATTIELRDKVKRLETIKAQSV